MTKKTALLKQAKEITNQLGDETPDQLALLNGLSEQQQTIVRFKIRGLTQVAIARFLKVTPARVSQEVKAIREHHIAKGSSVNQAALVGETLSIYEEVERKSWEVFHSEEGKKLRALETVMTARDRQMKLMMDLGLVKRAAIEHTSTVVVSPLMSSLTPERREEVIATLIQPAPGLAPSPPEDDEDPLYEALPETTTEH